MHAFEGLPFVNSCKKFMPKFIFYGNIRKLIIVIGKVDDRSTVRLDSVDA